MNCRQAEHHISAERDNALAPVQQQALVAHVAECEACRRLRDNLATGVESWRAMDGNVRIPDAEIEWQKVRREIRGGTSSESSRRWLTWMAVPLTAAAAVAIAVYVAPGSRKPGPATAPHEVATRQISAPGQAAAAVVYVDDKSGWTFVWDSGDNGRTI